MRLLPVSHQRQKQEADCLAACVAMVLDYLQVPIAYERLLRLLQVGKYGTPFRNLTNLRQLGLSVTMSEGNIRYLQRYLESGLSPIVAVDTGELSYWKEVTDHAVVVIGIDEKWVYLNDPDHSAAPQVVSLDEFELAWLEQDYRCAVIQLKS